MDKITLEQISLEIENKYDCKVITIHTVQLLSLCIMCKIKFNEDVYFKPFDDLPKPESICFSDRTITFFKRVDLFDCVRKNIQLN